MMGNQRILNKQKATAINALLPQTQCGRCQYEGCLPYAEAIAEGEANINQCPPGGQQTIDKLAALLECESVPLDPEYGIEQSLQLAYIDETQCIGCVKCIVACPVDAIIGAAKLMHTVIADHCTGCELCLAPCPMDCIDMVPALVERERLADKVFRDVSQQRYQYKQQRTEHKKVKASSTKQAMHSIQTGDDKQAFIAAAVQRSRARRLQQ